MTAPDDLTGAGGWDDVIVVDIDGAPVEYYPAGVEIPSLRIADLAGYEYRADVSMMAHPRLRRAVVQLRLARDVHRRFGALRWDDGADLDQLDRDLAPGASADARASAAAVLEQALFVVPIAATCRNCHGSALVLAVEAGDPGTSLRRQRNQKRAHTCPNCGDDRFAAHYEVLQP